MRQGAALLLFVTLASAAINYRGVNQASAEFTPNHLPGTQNLDWQYPSTSSIDWFVARGVNVFRVPFLWERVAPTLGTWNQTHLTLLDSTINYIASKGAYAIVDPHNYFQYYGNNIGSSNGPSNQDFANFWTFLANRYKTQSKAIFGLMNEPNSVTTEAVFSANAAATNAIRSAGATQLILVPGNAWTGGHSWTENWYGTPNSQVAVNFNDPGNNYAFDIHQYFDTNYGGSSPTCVSGFSGDSIMGPLTNWLRSNNRKAFVSEFGFGNNSNCFAAANSLLTHIENNNDVYIGWTYWAAGPMWVDSVTGVNYWASVEPLNGAAAPQWTQVLAPRIPAPKASSTVTETKAATTSSTPSTTKAATTSSTTAAATKAATTSSTSSSTSTSTTKAATTAAGACSAQYAQCGGQSWAGPFCCQAPYTCQVSNAYYSQCL